MFSIGIPTYNEIKYIKKTLESVESNIEYLNEVIISDNASTDGTSEVCQAFANKFPEKVTYIKQNKNIGVPNNFMFVLEKSSSDYFAWVGGHDQISVDFAYHISNAINHCKKDNIGCFYFDVLSIYNTGNREYAKTKSHTYVEGFEDEIPFNRGFACAKAFSENASRFSSIVHSVVKKDILLTSHKEAYEHKKSHLGVDFLIFFYVLRRCAAMHVESAWFIQRVTLPNESLLKLYKRYKKNGLKLSLTNSGRLFVYWVLESLRMSEGSKPENWESSLKANLKQIYYPTYNGQFGGCVILVKHIINEFFGSEIRANMYTLKLYNQTLQKWLQIKNSNKSLNNYFEKNNYNNIIIYGAGSLCISLIEELKNFNINIICIIDKIPNNRIVDNYNVISINELNDIQGIDIIVVTPINYFDSIQKEVSKYTTTPCISIEEIVYSCDESLNPY